MNRRRKNNDALRLAALVLLGTWIGAAQGGLLDQLQKRDSGFLPAEEAFVLSAVATASDRIEARWIVAPGYYLYRHRLQFRVLQPAGSALDAVYLPPGAPYLDEHFGEVEIYRDELIATLTVPGTLSGQEVLLEIRHQGCAEAGLCYPPRTQQLPVQLPAP